MVKVAIKISFMTNNFIETLNSKTKQTRWMPYLSLILSLFGIVFLHWEYQNIIILFVCEVFLMLSFALLKMFFARNELPFSETIVERLFFLVIGIFIGGFFTVLSVMIVSKSIDMDVIFGEIRKINYQIVALTLGYFYNLFFGYFVTQKFREAIPVNEMGPFIHVLVILAVLQGFTIHLFPSYPVLNQAVWGIVALVLVKFLVDLLFSLFKNSN